MTHRTSTWIPLAALWLAGCVAPTTYGLRTDGVQPDLGQPELIAHGGYVYGPKRTDIDGDGLSDGNGERYYEGDGWGGGTDLSVALSKRTALSLASGLGTDRFSSGVFGTAEVRYRTGPDPDAQVTGTLISGGGVNYWPQETWALGVHGGGLVTFNAHPVRFYTGAKLNLVAGGWFGAFPMATVGVSLRPVEGLVLGIEGNTIGDTDGWSNGEFILMPSGYAGWRF